MKTLFLTFISLISLLNLQAQELAMANLTSNLDSFIGNRNLTKSNSTYFFAVNNFELPKVVKELQADARNYNIKEAKVYESSEPAVYNVKLKKGKHTLNLTYNNNGQILNSKEVYKNIALPVNLRVKLSKKFPDWIFSKTKLTISFNHNNETQLIYNITLQKNNDIKELTINDKGELI
ncbi:hypothetical protein RXV94_05485 [Yeosuana sp. MJ-SS3]|uniref:DUF4251 domain-containing protein n=1 Tax=Gilvirhabdus luticola TaxID=3079858 RepID=A0ABU3U5C3_9FLAO|nr:hypothetical protein [Yeosuana sp. MJ-SS3]MDU8885602.1 hypothetical protein [Yeosuana sp. MJ-SS3]